MSVSENGGAVVVVKRVRAPMAAVFEFLVDPLKLVRWLGQEVEIDPQPGGRFWVNMNGTDVAMGNYVEVTPPHRVVFTWGWQGSPHMPPASSTVSIVLTEDGDHTLVELCHRDLPGGDDADHRGGWESYLPGLAAVSES